MALAPHSQDRTAAGIARSFADAGRDNLPEGMAEALAERIAKAGSWQAAYSAVHGKVNFSGWSDEDRWLYELIGAEGDADHPQTALNSLMDVLEDWRERDSVYVGRWARAVRLVARVHNITPADAEASLEAWRAGGSPRARRAA